MFHKNALPAASSARSRFLYPATPATTQTPPSETRLTLVPSGGGVIPQKASSTLFDLVSVSAHRCSSFFAEAAVLVLVLALLDRFMLKGHFEPRWILGAVTLSLLLLAASIATDLSARRWLQRH
jgi:hypothetical protein